MEADLRERSVTGSSSSVARITYLFRRKMTIDPRLHRIVAAQPYPLLFATISGAHLYGFPSPDSDFDLRGAHVLPLEKIVGLEVRDETVEQEMIVPPNTSSGFRPPSPQSGEGAGALERTS